MQVLSSFFRFFFKTLVGSNSFWCSNFVSRTRFVCVHMSLESVQSKSSEGSEEWKQYQFISHSLFRGWKLHGTKYIKNYCTIFYMNLQKIRIYSHSELILVAINLFPLHVPSKTSEIFNKVDGVSAFKYIYKWERTSRNVIDSDDELFVNWFMSWL